MAGLHVVRNACNHSSPCLHHPSFRPLQKTQKLKTSTSNRTPSENFTRLKLSTSQAKLTIFHPNATLLDLSSSFKSSRHASHLPGTRGSAYSVLLTSCMHQIKPKSAQDKLTPDSIKHSEIWDEQKYQWFVEGEKWQVESQSLTSSGSRGNGYKSPSICVNLPRLMLKLHMC